MKEIKFVLNSLFCGVYASSWWAAARWGHDETKETGFFLLWVICGLLTLLSVVFIISYLVENWHKISKY